MHDQARLESLRHRIEQDPDSIAFAQLAEEYRRAGQYQEAIECCRAGLAVHPAYLSARVTLGRALVALGQLDGAQQAFEQVLAVTPANLGALRGLADVYQKRGTLVESLERYRAALNSRRGPADTGERTAPRAKLAQAFRTLGALEQWLAAVHAVRAIRQS